MILRGPFNLKWGGNTLADIETIGVDYSTDSEDYAANSGSTYQIDKSIKASVSLTFLATDIPALAAVLPQYFVPEGGILGDGSIVIDERGAIDIKADDCDTESVYNDLEIESCGNPSESFKLMTARTLIDSFEIGKIRKIVVKFIGEPEAGKSIIQLLGDQGDNQFFQLGNDELFLLGDGNNLIL